MLWLIQSVVLRLLVFSVPWSCPGREREFIFRLGLAVLLLLTPLLRGDSLRGNLNITTIIINYRIVFGQVAMRSNA
jgi:hypothetical protein